MDLSVINHLRDDFGVEPVCRELNLSVSAYNTRRRRPKSARHRHDAGLVEHIRRIHENSGRTYGAPEGPTANFDAMASPLPAAPSSG